jgi:hypothetical protein
MFRLARRETIVLMVQPAGWVAKIAGLLPPNTASRAARKYGSLKV